MVLGLLGVAVLNYLLPAKWNHSVGDGVFGQPLWAASGSHLSVGKGAGFEVCNSRCGVWISENKIKSNGCRGRYCSPAIYCFPSVLA